MEKEDFAMDRVQIFQKKLWECFQLMKKKKRVQRYKYQNEIQKSKIFIYDCKH